MSGRPSTLGRLRDGWMAIVVRFGEIQTLVILALFYTLLIGPLSLAAAAGRRDLLQKRTLDAKTPSAWDEADTAGVDLERARLQS